jgi:alkylated DNA nucleotide flippase Atl1
MAFIAAVPPGRWTAFKDVAEAAGSPLAFMAIGAWLSSDRTVANPWRVLYADGSVPAGYFADTPGVPHDAVEVRQLLEREGIRFSRAGKARAHQWFGVKDWTSSPLAPNASKPRPTGIQVGAVVRAVHLASGEGRTWTLVESSESGPAMGRLSVKSPIGRALIGCGIGDIVTVSAPAGQRQYRILGADPCTPPLMSEGQPHHQVSAVGRRQASFRTPSEDPASAMPARAACDSPAGLPARMAHADWGTGAAKRVVATAELEAGLYHAHAPSIVGEHGSLIRRMRLKGEGHATTLLGFDFPIGVPRAFAHAARIENFADWFRDLDLDSSFFEPAAELAEVSVDRPFFPSRPPKAKSPDLKARFHEALGVPATELMRRCDRAHCDRRSASEMFWTIGPAAVGKATLGGWKDALRSGLAESERHYSIWPFDGAMTELLAASDAVIVETYPTEAYRQLGLRMGGPGMAKTRQDDRRADARRLLDWCADNAVVPDDMLLAQIIDGFGPTAAGEDLFDAVVGLFAMIDQVRRRAEPELPGDPAIARLEGWMFGQHAACPERR